MSSALGVSLESVRIHTGADAMQMSQELNAHAFTYGDHIYFNSGRYNPSSAFGAKLLAHELAHTVQQRGAIHRKIQRWSIHNPRYPCADTSFLPGDLGFLRDAGTSRDPTALRDQHRSPGCNRVRDPGSGLRAGRGRGDIVSSLGGVYEIKPRGLVRQGYDEAENYVAFAGRVCDPDVPWHLGDIYWAPPMYIGGERVVSWLEGPGVLAYTRTRPPRPVPQPHTAPNPQTAPQPQQTPRTQREVPQASPQPVPQPVLRPEDIQKIIDFARRVHEQGLDVYDAAAEFLRENAAMVGVIMGLGVVAMIVLLADDATIAGIVDDILIPIIAALEWVAYRMTFAF